VVNRTLLDTFTNPARSLQELVDCLQDQGTLTFEGSLLQLETLEIVHSITVQGSSESSTSIGCLVGPIFRVKYVLVYLLHIDPFLAVLLV